MEPDLIVYPILERALPALDNLTEVSLRVVMPGSY